MKRNLRFLFIILIAVRALGQTPDLFMIKASGYYYFGIGYASTEDLAKEAARNELINGIVSVVSSEYSSRHHETIGDRTTEYSQTTEELNKSYSRLQLKNLCYRQLESENGLVGIIAYISKSDFAKSVEDQKTEIRDYMRQVSIREKTEPLPLLIPDYYKIYLMTFFSPEPVSYCPVTSTDTIKSLAAYLESKIQSFLSKLTIVPGVPFNTVNLENQIEIPMQFSYNGQPVSKLTARLQKNGNPERVITDGKTTLLVFSDPSCRRVQYELLVSPAAPAKPELANLHSQLGIIERRGIQVDYSAIIKVDFAINSEGGQTYVFTQKVKNLSISKLEWDFGDGCKSTASAPSHTFRNNSNYKISLVINGDPKLRAARFLIGGEPVVEKDTLPEPSLTAKKEADSTNAKPDNDVVEIKEDQNSGEQAEQSGSITGSTAAEINAQQYSPNADIKSFKPGSDLVTVSLKLNSLQSDGRLVYGNEENFIRPEACYIFLLDSSTGTLKAIMSPGRGDRVEIFSGRKVTDYKTEFEGLKSVWVSVK